MSRRAGDDGGREERGDGAPSAEGARKDARGKGASCRPKNWLEPVVLLALRERGSHGYELMERAAAFGFEAMNPGTLYRTLRRMEKDGRCVSRWESPKGGPARRVYAVTDAGEAYLGLWAEALERYRGAMDAFLRAYQGSTAANGHGKQNDGRPANGAGAAGARGNVANGFAADRRVEGVGADG